MLGVIKIAVCCAWAACSLCLPACAPSERAAISGDTRDGQASVAFSTWLDERLDACGAHIPVESPQLSGDLVQSMLGPSESAPNATAGRLEQALCLRFDAQSQSFLQLRDVRTGDIVVRTLVPKGPNVSAVVYVAQIDEASAVVAIRTTDHAGARARFVAVLPCGASKDADGSASAGTFGSTLRAGDCPDIGTLAWFAWNGAGSADLARRKWDRGLTGMTTIEERPPTDAERALLDESFARWPGPVWCIELHVPDC